MSYKRKQGGFENNNEKEESLNGDQKLHEPLKMRENFNWLSQYRATTIQNRVWTWVGSFQVRGEIEVNLLLIDV